MKRVFSLMARKRLADAILFILFCSVFLWLVVELGSMWSAAAASELGYGFP